MNAADHQAALRSRVLERFDALTPQQRRAAEWLLDHLAEVAFLSVPALAKRAKVSDATVVRLCQSLGYEGFAELRDGLAEGLRRAAARPRRDALPPDPGEDTLDVVARLEVANVEATLAELHRPDFRAAATAIFRADHVYVLGLGVSSHLAALLAYLLTQIGLRATTLPAHTSSVLEPMVALRPTDLLVAFSFPPYSRATVEGVRAAGERGIPTLVVSDRPTAPAATLARLRLAVKTDNMMFTNSFAAVSVLLNALTTEIAMRHREQASEAVAEISRILDEDEGIVREPR